jgi:hypothetical protein
MVFNTTFNNISVISSLSVLLVEETGVPGENHRSAVSHRLHHLVSFNIVVLKKIVKDFLFPTNQNPWWPSWILDKVTRQNHPSLQVHCVDKFG